MDNVNSNTSTQETPPSFVRPKKPAPPIHKLGKGGSRFKEDLPENDDLPIMAPSATATRQTPATNNDKAKSRFIPGTGPSDTDTMAPKPGKACASLSPIAEEIGDSPANKAGPSSDPIVEEPSGPSTNNAGPSSVPTSSGGLPTSEAQSLHERYRKWKAAHDTETPLDDIRERHFQDIVQKFYDAAGPLDLTAEQLGLLVKFYKSDEFNRHVENGDSSGDDSAGDKAKES